MLQLNEMKSREEEAMQHFDDFGFMQRILEDMISKDGWAVMHRDWYHSAYVDIRTIGLPENFDHYNLQITAYMHIPIAVYIFRQFVEQIKNKIPLQLDCIYTGILKHHMLKLKKYELDEETVYRIIVSDKQGRFPNDPDCDVDFKFQEYNLRLLHILYPRDLQTE